MDILGTPIERFTRHMFTRIIRRLGTYDFTLSEVAALHIAGTGDGISVQALATQLTLSLSATSRLVERLVAKGLLLRRTNPGDARARIITCAKKGERLLDEMSLERVGAILEAAKELPPEIPKQILGAIAQFRKEE